MSAYCVQSENLFNRLLNVPSRLKQNEPPGFSANSSEPLPRAPTALAAARMLHRRRRFL
jgi:hypothetical protein